MGEVLYRKYRPSTFDGLVGQDHIKNILQEQIRLSRIGHAYLFSGPRGTGKTSVARIFAKEVNGLDKLNTTDVIEIDAASNRGIDEVRELKAKIDFVPSSSKYKVYVIDEVHMLTKEAFNALLKTIEEPPSHIIFVLATTEPHKVPQTILSRVMRFDFKLGTREEIKENILSVLGKENVKLDEMSLDFIVRLSRGSYRDSLSILQKVLSSRTGDKEFGIAEVTQILGYVDSEIINSFINALEKSNLESALKVISTVQDGGKSIVQFGFQTLEELREILFKIVAGELEHSRLPVIAKIIRELSQAVKDSKTALIDALPFEIAVLELCSQDVGVTVPKILEKPKDVRISKEKDTTQFGTVTTIVEKEISTSLEIQTSVSLVEFDKISTTWIELVERVKPYNHHLSAFLYKAKPMSLDNGTLIINVPFKLHKNKLESPASRKVMEKELGELWGVNKYVINHDMQMLAEAKKSAIEPLSDSSNSDLVEDIFEV